MEQVMKKMRVEKGGPARDIHVFLPEELVWKADKYVRLGLYRSQTEILADSLRRRMDELERGTEPETPARRMLRQPARSNHMVIANER